MIISVSKCSVDSVAHVTSQAASDLRDQVFNNVSVNIGQTEIPAGVSVGKLFVIKAEQLEHRSVQIVDVNFIFDGFEAELVGRSVNVSSFYPTAGQPGSEAPVVVVAAVNLTGV